MSAIELKTPITDEDIDKLQAGDAIEISGTIFVGRDAVLPKIVKLIEEDELDRYDIDLQGGVIFHSAVSVAGLGPTSSNKEEIEGNIPRLSEAGVKLHLGKGALLPKTVEALNRNKSIFVVIPPISAYLTNKVLRREVAAFKEEGMEAFWRLEVDKFPGIVAIAHGVSIF